MRKNLLVSLGVSFLVVAVISIGPQRVYGQEADSRVCADVPGQTSGTHRFRLGEVLEIPLRGEDILPSVAECDPVELRLNWSNGRNNGSMFNITLLDDHNSPIHSRQIPGFLPGALQIPLSSFYTRPGNGASLAMVSLPATVTIQAAEPFSAPAVLSFTVVRVPRRAAAGSRGGKSQDNNKEGNEVVSIHSVVRLIGASRIPLVQIELKTAHPFPVRDLPLQLRIGQKIFVEELSGDHTGRRLTLSLTPEMFADLKDGDEIVASFGRSIGNETVDQSLWSFGKLDKSMKRE